MNGFSQNATCPPGSGDVCAIVAWYFDNEGKGNSLINLSFHDTNID